MEKQRLIKKYNYTVNLLENLLGLINKSHFERIIWVGEHPFLPIIYQFLLDIGIKNEQFSIIDSNPEKSGKMYIPYRKQLLERASFERKYIERFIRENCPNDSLYILANTHYTEIKCQLNKYGIPSENIINLYDLTREHLVFQGDIEKAESIHSRLCLYEIQQIELRLLKDFSDYCDSNNLRYFLGGGTLLGAIRHLGFIPWDDDIDVYMPYEDYIIFLEGYKNKGRYSLLDWRFYEDYPLQFAQLTDCNTILFRSLDFMYSAIRSSVFIDIFPLGGYSNKKEEIENQWALNLELDREFFYYMIVKDVDGINPQDVRYKITNKRHRLSFDDSEYVGNVIRTPHYPWAVHKSIFDKSISVKFEDGFFKAPVGYDEYLKYRYGDYMAVPAHKNREQHLFPAFSL